jgi:hypothetical protein
MPASRAKITTAANLPSEMKLGGCRKAIVQINFATRIRNKPSPEEMPMKNPAT